MGEVVGADFDDDAGVAPAGVAGGGAHAVDDDLPGAGGGGDDEAAGAHAEAIDAPAAALRGETVLCRRQPGAPTLTAVVHDAVYHLAGVLEPDADGEALGLQLHALVMEHAVDIAGAMAGGEDDGAEDFLAGSGDNADGLVATQQQTVDTGLEAHLAAVLTDAVAHILDDARQTVGADMGMGGGEDVGAGAMLAEDGEDAAHVAALGGAGVELAVGVGAGTALAEGVVALRVDEALARDEGDILLALMDILAPLEDDGAQASLYQAQGSEEAGGTGSDDDDLGPALDIGVGYLLIGQRRGGLIDIDEQGEVDHDLPLTGIDAAARHPDALDAALGDAQLVGHAPAQQRVGGCHLRGYTEIELLEHLFGELGIRN